MCPRRYARLRQRLSILNHNVFVNVNNITVLVLYQILMISLNLGITIVFPTFLFISAGPIIM